MAFSPRRQHINQHGAKQTKKQKKSQNKPALHRCNGQRDGECGRRDARAQVEFLWAEAAGRHKAGNQLSGSGI